MYCRAQASVLAYRNARELFERYSYAHAMERLQEKIQEKELVLDQYEGQQDK